MSTHYLERGRALCGKNSPGVMTTEYVTRVTCQMCQRIIARRARPHAPNRAGMFSSQRICRACGRPRAVVGGRFVVHVDVQGRPCDGSDAVAPSMGSNGTRE